MKNLHKVLIKPYLTEKVLSKAANENQVVFQTHTKANKLEIKQAIETFFSVTVEKVATMNVVGKPKRQGKFVGKKSNWKKAVVTLKKDDMIDYFEGA